MKEGLHGQLARRKPYLSQGNRQKRLEFAKEYKKSTMKQWKNDLSGESKIEIISSKRRQHVRRRVKVLEVYN